MNKITFTENINFKLKKNKKKNKKKTCIKEKFFQSPTKLYKIIGPIFWKLFMRLLTNWPTEKIELRVKYYLEVSYEAIKDWKESCCKCNV